MISLTVPSPIASPVSTPTATIPVDEDHFIEIGAQLELYGGILQDHTQCLDVMPPTLFVNIDRDVRELYTSFIEARAGIGGMGRKATLQRELQEMRGRVTALEQEKDRKER
ncbi:hypothetical protein Tco_1076795 [Tanacetum coccineum]